MEDLHILHQLPKPVMVVVHDIYDDRHRCSCYSYTCSCTGAQVLIQHLVCAGLLTCTAPRALCFKTNSMPACMVKLQQALSCSFNLTILQGRSCANGKKTSLQPFKCARNSLMCTNLECFMTNHAECPMQSEATVTTHWTAEDVAELYHNFCPHLIISGIRLDSKVIDVHQHSRLGFLKFPPAPLWKHQTTGILMPCMHLQSSSCSSC